MHARDQSDLAEFASLDQPLIIVATRRGQPRQEPVALEHDGAVRSLVERLSGCSTAGESGLTFELPGDLLAHALFL
jgi:hypothetical protein